MLGQSTLHDLPAFNQGERELGCLRRQALQLLGLANELLTHWLETEKGSRRQLVASLRCDQAAPVLLDVAKALEALRIIGDKLGVLRAAVRCEVAEEFHCQSDHA